MLKQTIKMAAAGSASVSLLFMGGIASAHQQQNQKGSKDPGNVTICVAANTNIIGNSNNQASKTGKAKVSGNNTGGSASTGNAKNENTTGVTLDNSNTTNCPTDTPVQGLKVSGGGSGGGLAVQVTVNANANVISNSSVQSATSGSASVVCNTQGGNASTGNANNSNVTTIMVTNTNN